MKCEKCGEEFHHTGLGGAPIPTVCDKCEYIDCGEWESPAIVGDFRAFRRQVLLGILNGRRLDLDQWPVGDMWKDADRIARAEPKE